MEVANDNHRTGKAAVKAFHSIAGASHISLKVGEALMEVEDRNSFEGPDEYKQIVV